MLNKRTTKARFAGSLLISAVLAMAGCNSSGIMDPLNEGAVEGVVGVHNNKVATDELNQEAKEHNEYLLNSEGLEQVGEMNQGPVVLQKTDRSEAWVRDNKTHVLYPVKMVDGTWIMTPEGLAQRSLDKDKARDEKKKQQATGYGGGEGGEGGGGGGGD